MSATILPSTQPLSNARALADGAVLLRGNFVAWPNKPSGGAAGHRDREAKLAAVAGVHMPEVVVCEHIDFGGAEWRTNLGWSYVGDFWNDKISSIIVVSGTWRFYEHANLGGQFWDLGPGYYHWVEEVGIPNDIISSFQPIGF
jgi:hypothetical protein